jgi:4-diphosphocytidyl-2-C-methyl-D-erythritol kinase
VGGSEVSAWDEAYPAPAKLNLFLHVVGRRADGYHLLQTVFCLLDRGDTLHFAPRADGRILRAHPLPGVAEDDDLTVRAARLLQEASGCRMGAEIRLDKRLPLGGGLGGGSSDAATVLLALNRLWGVGYPRRRLQELALRLGADVPFFVFGRSAFAEGIGEALQAVELPAFWYLVLVPRQSVPTQEIFAAADLTRNTKAIKMADFSAAWGGISGRNAVAGKESLPGQGVAGKESLPGQGVAGKESLPGHNDLESVVCRRYPEVARTVEWLKQFADARMTGSGACVFAPFATEQEANAVLARLPQGMHGWVARGIDTHPLHSLAE